jgi:hypothetical protein
MEIRAAHRGDADLDDDISRIPDLGIGNRRMLNMADGVED